LRFFLAAGSQCPLNKQRAGVTQLGGEPAAAKGQPVGRFRVTGVAVRFYGPKQRHTLAVHQHGYTDWITVDAIADPAVCFASLLYWYVRATEALPAGIYDDALFLSLSMRQDRNNQYFGLRPASLAGQMKGLMAVAGIPLDFKPHSARHAGMAAGKAQGWSDEDLCARANMSMGTYKAHYAQQVRRQVSFSAGAEAAS
jgi:hypothetical protein